jgi:hypothetical protein
MDNNGGANNSSDFVRIEIRFCSYRETSTRQLLTRVNQVRKLYK